MRPVRFWLPSNAMREAVIHGLLFATRLRAGTRSWGGSMDGKLAALYLAIVGVLTLWYSANFGLMRQPISALVITQIFGAGDVGKNRQIFEQK
jgi:hypothetical protein